MSAYALPRVTTVTERDRNAFPKHMDKKMKRKKKKLMKEVGAWGSAGGEVGFSRKVTGQQERTGSLGRCRR